MTLRLRSQAALFLAILIVWLLVTEGLAKTELDWAEPLPLRWLRKAAEHPIRTPIALWLVAVGLTPSPGEGTRAPTAETLPGPRG